MTMNEGCRLCPRKCDAERSLGRGFCGASEEPEVSAICLHGGEEPPLNPIVNVFFSHCNLHCIYCQNGDISGTKVDPSFVHYRSVGEVAERICELLPQSDNRLGFVTASHYAYYLPVIVEEVRRRGFEPTVVYNSSGYESIETLQTLEGLVDIYLPDVKYMHPDLAFRYSHARDYPEVACAALKEMIRQVGIGLKIDEGGHAYRGLIVRHLVLPGHVDNSLAVLDQLAHLHTDLPTLSLMAQYFPPKADLPSPLDRSLNAEEYRMVADRYMTLGFEGWLQDLDSGHTYRPDFTKEDNPFDSKI